ncbi:hypothetical protein Tcan_07236 [Toxocara canis]|uniref:Uncharacterized protein n=1 Tax=Toxocara canis TaxID=6265 RepID=A0A0B2UU18_TOXCA|nr:hypothetical protein Tcan_07236 [Toxocara canis]
MSTPRLTTALLVHKQFKSKCAPFFCGFGVGGCYPAPPPVICPVCSMGFICAPTTGVCVSRARLHTALTQDAGPDESLEDPASTGVADKEFQMCCELGAVPDGCLNKCSYNEYNRRNVHLQHVFSQIQLIELCV